MTNNNEDNSGRIHLPPCLRDYKKMTLAASLATMTLSVLCVGFLVNDLMDITSDIEKYEGLLASTRSTRDIDAPGYTKPPTSAAPSDPGDKLRELTITKVLYTILICELVLLLISSVALMKGVFQRKQSLIMAWMLIVAATVIYAGAIIIRDISIHLSSAPVYHGRRNLSQGIIAKLGFYSLFVIMEAGFLRYVIQAFREVRRQSQLNRGNVACFDPRHPDNSIYTITPGSGPPPDPENLFKLPTYEEVTTENTEGTSGSDKRGEPPPYAPPAYTP